MIDAGPSLRAATQVSTSALAAYLHLNGWAALPSRMEGVTVFVKNLPDADGPVHILLSESGSEDEHHRVAAALRTIEAVEERPLAMIARDIAQIANRTKISERFNSENTSQRTRVPGPDSRGATDSVLVRLSRLPTFSWVAVLIGLFALKLQISEGGALRAESFFRQEPLPFLLTVLEITIYALSNASVKLELSVASKLFPPDRTPSIGRGPTDRRVILASITAFLISYSSLILLSDWVQALSLVMVIIACFDWNTRRSIQTATAIYFSDEYYSPRREDPYYDLIYQRRSVYQSFIDRPHLWKEGLRVAGCGLAFALSILGYFYGLIEFRWAAYSLLIFIVLLNEAYTLIWRYGMKHDIDVIDAQRAALPNA
jgi:hypothetical protein